MQAVQLNGNLIQINFKNLESCEHLSWVILGVYASRAAEAPLQDRFIVLLASPYNLTSDPIYNH